MKVTLEDLYLFNKETGLIDSGYFKVNTKNGFKKIITVDITEKNSEKIILSTINNEIKVSPKHLLYEDNWKYSNDINIGDIIETDKGKYPIIDKKIDKIKEDLYDLQVEDDEYYANGFRSHNSTIKRVLELCAFNKVQGEKGKRIALTKLPNRRNGALYAGIFFKNFKNQTVSKKIYIQPNDFEMFVDNEDYSKKFKNLTEKQREEIIGYNPDVFKSFISLNINDFKNFISLSTEDKENLLNKLFNLTEFDSLLSIVKEIDKNNQKLIDNYENLIYENNDEIDDFRKILLTIKSNKEKTKDEKLNELKEQILSKKPRYDELTNLINKSVEESENNKIKYGKLKTITNNKESEQNKIELRIDDLKIKIKHFESGICPICETDLKDNTHIHKLDDYKNELSIKQEEYNKCDKFLEQCFLEDVKLNNKNRELFLIIQKNNEELNQLKIELATLNKQFKELKETEDKNSTELDDKIKVLINKNKELSYNLDGLNKKKETYKILIDLFSVDGIRKNMIKNIIKPINKNLNTILNLLDSEYKAVLDENFDAKIYELDILEISAETISKGEDKKINIAIALSYLKTILEKRHCNLMFLDEIFDGVDSDNRDLMLNVLKDFSREYKVNIIVIYHDSNIKMNIFDKIIKVKKDIFSSMEVIKN